MTVFRLIPSCRFKLKVICVCIVWYFISAAGSISNKMFLQSYAYPITLSLSNLMAVPLYAIPVLRYWEGHETHLTTTQFYRYLLPISIGKALAVGSGYFSLLKVPVSYAHTVKASMPLFAVFLSRLILQERQSSRVYLSLIPIVVGVVIASCTELSFSMIGLCAALFSTFVYSFLNILVKKLLKESDMHPIRLLAKNSQIASLIFFPIWLIHDAWNIISDVIHDSSFAESATGTAAPDLRMICLLAASGFLSFLQNLCSFTLINELTALSYAVCNAAKRITVIGASLLTLHNPVTATNVLGMMLAIAGVFCYNRAKQHDREESHTLPLSRTHTSLSDATLVAYDPQKLHDSDILYRAINGRATHEGSRLGEFSDEYANSYNQHRMDDISKEKSGRSRNVRFA